MTDSAGTIIEVTIAGAPDLVWRALRDPALIRRWHGWDFAGLDDEVASIYLGEVTEDAAAHTLVVQGGDRFTLREQEGTTIVRITRPTKGGDPETDAWHEDITEGWTTFLQQLRFGLEHHGLAPRRTLFLEGPTRNGAGAVDILGLGVAAGQPTGERYRATSRPGDHLQGMVYFKDTHQLALTIDDLGPGLLVLAPSARANTDRSGGRAQIILTTYELDDDEFDALAERWTRWWAERPLPTDASR